MTSYANGKTIVKLLTAFLFFSLFVPQTESKSRVQYQKKLELAQQHYKRVAPLLSCRLPRPRIFQVQTAGMQLVPAATVLHRCGKQAGCCSLPTHTCVAKTKEKVKLYFLVKAFPGAVRRRNKIKKFVMTNHTECHCMDISHRPR